MKYSRFIATPQVVQQVKEQTNVSNDTKIEQNNSINDIIKQKNFRQEKYLQLVKQWMDTNYEYEYMSMSGMEELRQNYSAFIKKNADLNNYFCTFSLNLKDIPQLDNRYIYKRCCICKSCNTRHFKNCCDAYHIKNRMARTFIVNMKPRLVGSLNLKNVE